MTTPGSVLVVCTGNVCRSPYLHRRLAAALEGSAVTVSSAGTGALAGHPMDERMAALLGGDADPGFVARAVTKELVLDADLVLTATRAHRTAVTRLAPRALRTTFAAADFAQLADTVPDEALLPGGALHGIPLHERVVAIGAQRAGTTPLAPDRADIVDPFRLEDVVYREAAEQVDRVVPSIVRVLR